MAKQPEIQRIAVAPVYSKFSTYPSNGLTPQRLAQIFREADAGDVSRQMELFSEIEEKDPHIASQLQTRKNAVTGLNWEVVPCSDREQDKAVASFVEEQLRGIPNVENALTDLLDALGKGIALSEIQWGYQNGFAVVHSLEHVDQKLLLWDEQDQMRLITAEVPTGVYIPPNKFIVHQYRARSGHPSRAGILRVCAWMYLFKNYSVKDWVAFAETYGMPLRLGKYDVGASEDDRAKLMQALIQLGTDAAGMVPNGTAIEFIEANRATSVNVYESLARYCDEQTSKAILGQTLTADAAKSGSYAQSKTHDEVRHDLTVADCKALAATLRDGLIRPLVEFNFGNVGIPSIVFDSDLPEDRQLLSIVYRTLHEMGVPIPLQHIYKVFSIPEPQPGEAVTTRQPPMLPFTGRMEANSNPIELDRETRAYQEQLDQLVSRALAESGPVMESMAAPLQRLLSEETDLKELQRILQDPERLGRLLEEMDGKGLFTQRLQAWMLAADLIGRAREHDT